LTAVSGGLRHLAVARKAVVVAPGSHCEEGWFGVWNLWEGRQWVQVEDADEAVLS
jgi:hypothetical protein